MTENTKTVTFEFPVSFVVGLGRDIGDHTFDLSKFTAQNAIGVFRNGLKQASDDGGAQAPKDLLESDWDEDDAKREGVMRRARAIQDNTHGWQSGGGGGKRLSETTMIARKWITFVLTNKKGVHKLKSVDADKMVARSLADSYAYIMPEGDYDSFMADAAKEAAKRAKTVNPLLG